MKNSINIVVALSLVASSCSKRGVEAEGQVVEVPRCSDSHILNDAIVAGSAIVSVEILERCVKDADGVADFNLRGGIRKDSPSYYRSKDGGVIIVAFPFVKSFDVSVAYLIRVGEGIPYCKVLYSNV